MPMSEPDLSLRSVRSLLTTPDGASTNYLIRAYQRGYRWPRTQVKQLLDDIWEFITWKGAEGKAPPFLLPAAVGRQTAAGRPGGSR